MISILKKHSVLYVEDEPEIQLNIAEYLENYFGNIVLASDGYEALAQYKKHQPDVLLLDINLPNLDGLTVAREIRKHDQTIKIIMLTAFTEKEKLLKAVELKLTRYLIKPVPPKAFKEALSVLAGELMNNPSRFLRLSDDITWDVEKESLSFDGERVVLSEKEHRLLKLFISLKGKSISYDKIAVTVWDNTFDRDVSIESIKNQVSQLRKKIPSMSISSVYGEGYVLK